MLTSGGRRQVVRVAVLLAVVLALLVGCTGNALDDAVDTGGAGAGAGPIEYIPVAERTTSITLTGTTLEGKALDTSAYRGQVVVINTWGSWCPPCNAEAPALAQVSKALAADGVQFVGVDLKEEPATGQAFQRKYGITYPSFAYGDTLAPQLKGKAPSPPTTIVLDTEGRMAARATAEIDEKTLTGMVTDVLNEKA